MAISRAAELSVSKLQEWLGRGESRQQRCDPRSTEALAATLGLDPASGKEGGELPPGWHWLMFNTFSPETELTPDGLPTRIGFLPPMPGLARMWASGRLTWHRPMIIGRVFERRSRLVALDEKQGRSGRLVFATVRHNIDDADGPCMTEDYTVVFRMPHAGPMVAELPAAPTEGVWERRVTPSALMLFCYSALTFNAHRIHYDHPYATEVEGYPGLLVHGPLTATLLLDLVRRNAPGKRLTSFTLRAMSPLFVGDTVTLRGAPEHGACRVWAANPNGALAMDAGGTFES